MFSGIQGLIAMPAILQSVNASVVYRAVETCLEDLNLEAIEKIASKTKVALMTEVPDNASYNYRKMHQTALDLPSNMLYVSDGCSAHICHRIVEASTREQDIIGELHAVSWTCGLPKHHQRMMKEARDIVNEELVWHPGIAPQAEWTEIMEDVLQHTTGRTNEMIKGGILNGDALLAAQRGIRKNDRSAKIKKFLNNDPRSKRLVDP